MIVEDLKSALNVQDFEKAKNLVCVSSWYFEGGGGGQRVYMGGGVRVFIWG